MINKVDICPCCNKSRTIFYNGMCQGCYKSNNYYKKNNKNFTRIYNYNGNSKLINTILECWKVEKISASDVYRKLNSQGTNVTYQYCWKIINKYGIERCKDE